MSIHTTNSSVKISLTGLSHLSYDEKYPFVVHLDSTKKIKCSQLLDYMYVRL